MSESSLIPIEQKTVMFYDDEITAVVVQSGNEKMVYVPVNPICEYLGLDWSSQRKRINRDPILAEAAKGLVIMTNPSFGGRGGGPQELLCLPLDYLNGWLFGVSPNRAKPEIREKLLSYQRECYRVLSRHFITSAQSVSPTSTTLAQVEAMGLAIATMAREQMEIEARLGKTEIVAQATAITVVDLQQRIEGIEAKLTPPAHVVTDAQASQISQAVKAVGLAYGKQTGRVEFGAVYGELYRKFEVTSYKLIPASKFEAVMQWLSDWYQSLTNEELPF
jgi:hypothetical protein